MDTTHRQTSSVPSVAPEANRGLRPHFQLSPGQSVAPLFRSSPTTPAETAKPSSSAEELRAAVAQANRQGLERFFRVDGPHLQTPARPHLSFAQVFDPNEYEGWSVQDISFGVSSDGPSAESQKRLPPTPASPSPMAIAPSGRSPSLPNTTSGLGSTISGKRDSVTPIEQAADNWSARTRAQIVGFDWNESRRDRSPGLTGQLSAIGPADMAAPHASAQSTSTLPMGAPMASVGAETGDRQSKQISQHCSPRTSLATGIKFTEHGMEMASPVWPDMTDRMLLTALPYVRQIGTAVMRPHGSATLVPQWLVTATERGAGATTLGLSVARWLAAQNQRVLLVDADFHSAGLSRTLAIDGSFSWLSTLRTGSAINETVVRFSGTSLAVLPLSPVHNRHVWAENLLDHLAPALAGLRAQFDQILLDVGPMSQWVAETQRIEQLSRRCMLVVRHAAKDQQQLQQTQVRLNGLGFQQLLVANVTPTLRAAA